MPLSEFAYSLFPGLTNTRIYSNTTIPTGGTFARGDFVLNSAPSNGSPLGWVCTVAGSPGTWSPVAVPSPTNLGAVSLTAYASMSPTVWFAVINTAAAGTVTLAPAASFNPGTEIGFIVATTFATTFAAATGNQIVGTAAVTGTANTAVTVTSDGVSTWFRTK